MRDAGTFQRSCVNEYVSVTLCGCDKSKTFGCVEPFHGAIGHRDVSFVYAARMNAAAWPSVVRVATEAERRQKIKIGSLACP
jgi:hypothetical protein